MLALVYMCQDVRTHMRIPCGRDKPCAALLCLHWTPGVCHAHCTGICMPRYMYAQVHVCTGTCMHRSPRPPPTLYACYSPSVLRAPIALLVACVRARRGEGGGRERERWRRRERWTLWCNGGRAARPPSLGVSVQCRRPRRFHCSRKARQRIHCALTTL